uniref:Gfo/Idh/MocA-like oxidoreductase N-terminal domain-containing protein n=1 Tax=Oryza punctata TaxID=4537 RepID=A0A0E0LR60_ORYPU
MAATAAAVAEVRYGIVGVGMMGREHLHNLAHLAGEVERVEPTVRVRVTCLADPHPESLRLGLQLAGDLGLPAPQVYTRTPWPSSYLNSPFALINFVPVVLLNPKRLEGFKIFSGHGELLDSGLCDAVVVSSPNMTHYQILMDIISHPKPHHILVEKPLCTTVQDCQKVVEAAKQRSDILVQVGLEYRYMPPVAKLIDTVKSGTLGQVRMVAIREHRFPFLVKVNNWNRFNCNSGGTLVEKCCHFFDLMRLFAAANPVRVMASGAIDVNHKDEVYDGKVPDIIDNAYVIVEFDNGSRGMLDLCMFAEGSRNEQEISVVGDIGKTEVISSKSIGLLGEAFVPESIVRVGKRTGGRDGVVTIMAEDERIKLQGASGPSVDLTDGLLSVAIGVAGQLSIEKGRFVTIEEVLAG